MAKVIALTGAGISKSAGIPTFEEIPDVQQKLSIWYRKENPKEFQKAWDYAKNMVKDKQPTRAHYALAKRKVPIITQNIDGLHQAAGSEVVIELHGSVAEDNMVLYCEPIYNTTKALDLLFQTVIDNKPEEELFLLIIGTRLGTSFAAELKEAARKLGYHTITINENADERVPAVLAKVYGEV